MKIVEAKGLPNVELLPKNDISDPFVKFWFGVVQNDLHKKRTKTIDNNLSTLKVLSI